MFKNKFYDRNNICGETIFALRNQKTADQKYISQRKLADMMQLEGVALDKNQIQRIECGKRFVTDIELAAFAKVFNVSPDYLLRLR